MSKTFWKTLLISPAVLGATLFVSTGVNAQVSDGDMLRQINDYSNEGLNSEGQVTSITQLRDVSPGDWAYEALRNLVERYGCIAGYPDGTFRGRQAMTRFEFAAGLNACLQQIERLIGGIDGGDLETLRRLLQEFEAELAALGARVDNLEGRVAFLEDHQFSTTTKLTGEVIFGLTDIFGGGDFNGLDDNNTILGDRVRLTLNTSFTGKDTLVTRLAAGNMSAFSNFGGDGALAPTTTQTFNVGDTGNNDVIIDWVAYYNRIGNVQTYIAAAGGIHQDYAPTTNPYFQDFDGGNGALSTFASQNPIYRIGGGAGVGASFEFGLLESILGPSTITVGYLAGEANDPSEGNGLFNGNYGALGQINFNISDSLNWGFTYVHGYNDAATPIFGSGGDVAQVGTNLANYARFGGAGGVKVTNSYGTQLAWRVSDAISFSGFFSYTDLRVPNGGFVPGSSGDDEIWSWGAGVAFPDLGKEGSVLGIFGGAQPYLGGAGLGVNGNNREVPYHIEAFYKYQVTDNISLTPGIIWLTNPNQRSGEDDAIIGTIRTTFTF
jgi:hypothetical protein